MIIHANYMFVGRNRDVVGSMIAIITIIIISIIISSSSSIIIIKLCVITYHIIWVSLLSN